MFSLDPILDRDTAEVCALPLCRVRLMRDARYPWLVLVPAREEVVEIGDLAREDRVALMDEIVLASRAIEELYEPAKMNVAAIGNIVRQLHVHVVGRNAGDPAWPGPVWGHSAAVAYTDDALSSALDGIRELLGDT
jgi:diadenosine tetraphosphate (Ap4A) HIT family hydrolase